MKMKKIFSIISLLSLLMAAFLSCKKTGGDNVFSEYDIVDGNAKALIKINYAVAFYNNPSVQVKINDIRVSGLIQNRTPFPGGGFNTLGSNTGDYLPVDPGANTKVSITIPKRGTNIDSLDVYTTTIATAAGKRYSLHVTDSLTRRSLLVDEDASIPDSGFVRMRFVNLMPTTPSVDLWVGTTKVASNIAYMSISDKFLVPTSQQTINTNWYVRVAGTVPATVGASALATYSSASTFNNQRVYTVYAIGYPTYPSTGTDIRKPYVAFYYVR
ncbi:MAG: DUF4397 domain-containing protein [Flavobacteriales bacterium]|nr:MAG: DUF4397 domain-containing protein [Flavobacteriales bacterium]